MNSIPIQLLVWCAAFLLWYAIYVASFLRAFGSHHWFVWIPELIVFTIIWLLAVTSMAMAILTRPVPIPKAFHIPPHVFLSTSDESASEGLTDRMLTWAEMNNVPFEPSGTDRFTMFRICEPCSVVKPPRAHHCSKCNVCVLRMDHHCMAIGGCVHRDNHRHFLQFLFWSDVLCLFAVATVVPTLVIEFRQRAYDDYDTVLVVDFVLCVYGSLNAAGAFLVLLGFQVKQYRTVLRNQTALDEFIKKRTPEEKRHELQDYDVGSRCANLQDVLGRPGIAWLLPIPKQFEDIEC